MPLPNIYIKLFYRNITSQKKGEYISMKKTMCIITLLITTAGFVSANNLNETAFSKGAHYTANNCEIFIDKISANNSSHAYRGLNIWIKTINSSLDSEIAEVGFRYKKTGMEYSYGPIDTGWKEKKLTPLLGSKDYFTLSIDISSGFGWAVYEGAFYVRTKAGTNYWFKPAGGGNFVFDENAYNNIANAMGNVGYSSGVDAALPTQRDDLNYYNPGVCH